MKKLILFFIILLLAVALGVAMQRYPGYVLVNLGHTQIESTLWFALLLWIFVFFLGYWIIRLLSRLIKMPGYCQRWAIHHRELKAHHRSQRAIGELLEGNWQKAESMFEQAIASNPKEWLNYLGAAKAAHERQADHRRDQYLKQAKNVGNSTEWFPTGIVQASWQLERKQYADALLTLKELQAKAPHHVFVLRGLKEVWYGLGDWNQLLKLIPQLSKYKAMPLDELEGLSTQVYGTLLQQADELADIEKIWRIIPKVQHDNSNLLALYVKKLIAVKAFDKAENLLKYHLRHHLDESLLICYANVHSADPARQLSRAEEWLVQHPQNAFLLYCLGQICIKHRLWGKARNYLEQSIAIRPGISSYQALAEVLVNLEDTQGALDCYRLALYQVMS